MQIGWRKVGWAEFFRTAPSGILTGQQASFAEQDASQDSANQQAAASRINIEQQLSEANVQASQSEAYREQHADADTGTASGALDKSNKAYAVPPAEFVKPLYISKVNTVSQLGLIAGCISHSWYGWPAEEALWGLGGVTAVATLASFAAYVQVYRRGSMGTKVPS